MISKIGSNNSSEENQKEHKIKELKVLKSKLKPLYEDYRNSLNKLKEKIVSKPKLKARTKNDPTFRKRKLLIIQNEPKKLNLEELK